jgi:hypothetical protein
MHRRDGKRRSTIACRHPTGIAMGRSRYSRRTAVLSMGSVAGCRLNFFKAEGLLICRTDALKNPGKQKESAAGKSGGFLFFRGEHIDHTRTKFNIYFDCYTGYRGNGFPDRDSESIICFEEIERMYYTENYGDFLEGTKK